VVRAGRPGLRFPAPADPQPVDRQPADLQPQGTDYSVAVSPAAFGVARSRARRAASAAGVLARRLSVHPGMLRC
jgi:hypothetical protein